MREPDHQPSAINHQPSTRVVVIGGSGFVGSNLIRYLEIPDMAAPSEDEADLTVPESLRRVLSSGDIVINAAGYANATDRTEKGKALFQIVNVDGVRYLAEACVEAGVAQLVHISSVAAMGRWRGESITEDMMKPVTSPYAASKLAGERVLAEFADRFPITILRPTSVFGEGRGLAATLCSIISMGVVPLPDGGKARIPFTYIGNVAHAVKLAIRNERCFGRTFIVGDAESYPLREIVLALADAMKIKAKIISVPRVCAYTAVRCLETLARIRGSAPLLDRGRLETMTNSVSYSIAAFQAATGYEPPYSLKDAAGRMASWYRRLVES